ncbi:DNA-binding protein WhiA [Mycolicibacterium aubagnense]|uniref:DNA-binding protein WhiA n=1 Tax=Mycolicibacterium aubagnense TaxID=319707 RepID=UPI0013D2B9F3|nr:DNA-binding protein WhiA [Mycolicibacterium aubagnense]
MSVASTEILTRELLKVAPADSRCARAEIVSMLRLGGGVRIAEDGRLVLDVVLDAAGAAHRLAALVAREYRISPHDGGYHILGDKVLVRLGECAEPLARSTGLLDHLGRPVTGIPVHLVALAGRNPSVAAAALRGAVLARGRLQVTKCGPVTLMVQSPGLAETLAVGAFVRKLGGTPQVRERRHAPEPHHVVMVHDYNGLHKVAAAIGAPNFAKSHIDPAPTRRAVVHNRGDLVTANRNRAATAGTSTAERVAAALNTMGGAIADEVVVVAKLRMAHPAESMAELGGRCVPPLSKNTVAGRLRRLLEAADRRTQNTSLSA